MKNLDAVRETLAELLRTFDVDCNEYQTDIYAYYDPEEDTVEIDTFVNVGGNSWLNDDHIFVYADKPHYDSLVDMLISEESDFADAAGMSLDDYKNKVAEHLEIDVEDVNYYDLKSYAVEFYNDEIEKMAREAFEVSVVREYAYIIDDMIETIENAIEERYSK